MKIKKGMFRIYVVLSIIWFIFWIFSFVANDYTGDFDSAAGHITLLTAIIPLPLYFVIKWILKGFE